jgi:hypothetical protein
MSRDGDDDDGEHFKLLFTNVSIGDPPFVDAHKPLSIHQQLETFHGCAKLEMID